MSRSRKPYVHRQGNVYHLNAKQPPRIEEPSLDVKAQIYEMEKDGAKSFQLDKEGRVHRADVEPIDLYVAAEGVKAASWLIWAHRKQFHQAGQVHYYIKSDVQTPIWFRVAFEYLRRRSKNFFVYLTTYFGKR